MQHCVLKIHEESNLKVYSVEGGVGKLSHYSVHIQVRD